MNEYGRGLTHPSWETPGPSTHEERLMRCIAGLQRDHDQWRARKLAEAQRAREHGKIDQRGFRNRRDKIKHAGQPQRLLIAKIQADLDHHRECLAAARLPTTTRDTVPPTT